MNITLNSKMDELQAEVFHWYQQFKQGVRHQIRHSFQQTVNKIHQKQQLQQQQKMQNENSPYRLMDIENYPRLVLDDQNVHYFIVRLDQFATMSGIALSTLIQQLNTSMSSTADKHDGEDHVMDIFAMLQFDNEVNSFYFS